MAIGPSGGMLKKVFDPSTMKKKTKTALGYSKSGGPNIKSAKPFPAKGSKGIKLMNSKGGEE